MVTLLVDTAGEAVIQQLRETWRRDLEVVFLTHNSRCCRVSGDELQHPGFSVPALLLLVGGLAGIAVNGRYSETVREHKEEGALLP